MAELQLGNIKPAGAENVVVDSKYVKGSYVVVSTIIERDSLKGANGKNVIEGSLCYVSDEKKFYQYIENNWNEFKFSSDITVENSTLVIK